MNISLYQMQELVQQIVNALVVIWGTFTTPLTQVIQNMELNNDLVDAILSLGVFIAIGDMSLLELMLTTGITFYLVYQFAIWLANILT